MAAKIIKIKQDDDGLELFRFVVNICETMVPKDIKIVAEEASVSPSTIYRWCNYHMTSPHLRTVCRVLGALGYEIQTTTKASNLRAA